MSPFEFRPAKREAAPVLVGIAGPSGGGKTYSALRLARGLANNQPFAMIDTENGRALHYADYFPEMRHAHLRAPFSPSAYVEAIKAADQQGFPVIVVDSTSHEWEGEGGVLDMQRIEFERMGSKESARMKSWIAPKSEHKKLVRALLQVKAHVILNMRAQDQIEIVKVGGKTEVRAKETLTSILGWIPICERRLPFELTMSFLVTPDAPGVPKPVKLQEQHKAFFPADRPISEDAGVELARWAGGAEPVSSMDRTVANLRSNGGLAEPGVSEAGDQSPVAPPSGVAAPGSVSSSGGLAEPVTHESAEGQAPPAGQAAGSASSSLDMLISTYGREPVAHAYRELFPGRGNAQLTPKEIKVLAGRLTSETVNA